MTEFEGLGVDEKDALLVVACHLLGLEHPPSVAAASRLSLLWLDWAMADDPASGREGQPAVAPPKVARPEAPKPDEGFTPELARAVAVLSRSPLGLRVGPFLRQLAEADGVSEAERGFLDSLEVALAPGYRGPYR